MDATELAESLELDLPDNGDHTMFPFEGPRGGRYTLYAYREFRAKGSLRYTFHPQPLTPETPRELTRRLIVGCICHFLSRGPKIVQIRKVLPVGWDSNQLKKLATCLHRSAFEEDERLPIV